MSISEDNIVFLLGAGASVDAGIPSSNKMVEELEGKISGEDSKFITYKDLYNFLRSSIQYSFGLQGDFDENFNIEQLLIVMEELVKRDRNIIYPFIGTWNIHLLEVAGEKFTHIAELRELIERLLTDEWVKLKDDRTAKYYAGLVELQKELGHSLRIFSLNYDLCVENTVGKDRIQSGFGEDKIWHYSNFDESEESKKQFYLYKLHGSLDWYKDKEGLKISDASVTKPELIFGIDAKLRAHDPYLFYMQEFRRYVYSERDCKIIVVVGYSFQDGHINSILRQSIQEPNRKIIIVSFGTDDRFQKRVYKELGLEENSEQVEFERDGARSFFLNQCNIEYFSNRIIANDEVPF